MEKPFYHLQPFEEAKLEDVHPLRRSVQPVGNWE